MKGQIVCLKLEPGVADWNAQANPLSYVQLYCVKNKIFHRGCSHLAFYSYLYLLTVNSFPPP